jgi:prevent-host-death family protein
MTEIGAFKAKTQFSRLLDRAKNGEEFTITHRGVPVAKLVPAGNSTDIAEARAALARLRQRANEGMNPPISIEEILDWRDSGRL